MKQSLRSVMLIVVGVALFTVRHLVASDPDYCYSRFIPPVIYTDGKDSTTLEVVTTGTNIKQVWGSWSSSSPDSLQLYDDATHGDRIAGDGIYTRSGFKKNSYGYNYLNGQYVTYGAIVKLVKKDHSTSKQTVSIGFVKADVKYAHAVLGAGACATRSAFFISDTKGEIFPGYPLTHIVCSETVFPKAYQKLYSYFADAFDFIAVIPASDLFEPTSFAIRVPYCIMVKNNVQHIGVPIFDESANYGSAGRLKAVIYHSWGKADVLDHEQGHMWGMRAGFSKGLVDGVAGADKRYGHWMENADVDGKMSGYVNGKRLVFNGDGTWRLREQSATSELFSPLELYIMGLIPASEVPPIHLLTNPNYSDPNQVTCDSYQTITIDHIMAAEGGPRIPAYPNAQRAFNAAFIFVTNTTFTEAEFAFGSLVAEFYASDLAGSLYVMPFETATGHRATLDVALPGMESVGVQDQAQEQTRPNDFSLQQNYPNPFNATTLIAFSLQQPGIVTIKIYNALGQTITTLVDRKHYSYGKHTLRWNGLDHYGAAAASGIYFAELTVQQEMQKIKMVLVR